MEKPVRNHACRTTAEKAGYREAPGVPFLFRVAAQSQVADCVTVEGPYWSDGGGFWAALSIAALVTVA